MKASDHTEAMLAAWKAAGIGLADLAVKLPDGEMLWQRGRALAELPLAWPRATNSHGAEVYIRPARGFDWPLLFLDDVAVAMAEGAVRAHGGLAVRTSPAGGCHLWLPCTRPLDEVGRCRAQRWLAKRFGADPGSISGEHLGRMAGFRNWKRVGCWVNVLGGLVGPHVALDIPQVVLDRAELYPGRRPHISSAGVEPRPGGDSSPSGMEWGWVCRMLEAGRDPEQVRRDLVAVAWSRRGLDVERYARRTVERAMAKVGRPMR